MDMYIDSFRKVYNISVFLRHIVKFVLL